MQEKYGGKVCLLKSYEEKFDINFKKIANICNYKKSWYETKFNCLN